MDLRIGNFCSNRIGGYDSNLKSNRRIVVYSFNVKFLLIDEKEMCGFVKNIARLLLGY